MDLQGRNLQIDMSGDDVRLLHDELAQIGFVVSDDERRRALFGPTTRQAVLEFQKLHRVATTGIVDASTAHLINMDVADVSYRVSGTVFSPERAGVGGLRVEIIDKNIGEDLSLATVSTDERGGFSVPFSIVGVRRKGKQQPDLQARVFAADGTLLATSDIRYNAAHDEAFNVMLPDGSTVLPTEYETLLGTISSRFTGRLSDLKQADDRQDITYLANKTGWDARAVAMAALADQFATTSSDAGLQPEHYYALFRAGLPANAAALYQTDADTAVRIWKQAIEQGVIPQKFADGLDDAANAFRKLSATHALDTPPVEGGATLKELLALSLGEDTERQQRFAELHVQFRADPAKLWEATTEVFGPETTKQLQLDGQLGYLTNNNAALIKNLKAAEQQPLDSLLDLAKRGYHAADKWSGLIGDHVPDQIPGADKAEKRARYAELIANQIRLSYPTAVVSSLVQSRALSLNVADDVHEGVVNFLDQHQGKFEIGMHPVEQYLARNNLTGQVPELVTSEIKRLQRVYQITPDDQAFTGLLKHDLDSAYKVVRYSEDEFVNTFKDDLGGDKPARLTYAKSLHVHNTVLNIVTSYLTLRNAPALGKDMMALVVDPTPGGALAQAQPGADVIAYPTLEGLFGAIDFCTCEECRSILSPAAYLVDLLMFIDRATNEKENPLDVLLERRPDIQHLPLTCENTNTPLPYIDLVNETLEYFITNGLSPANYTGHTTDGSASAAELRANPEFVLDAAYDLLRGATFPPPLPFDRELETVRRTLATSDVELAEAMERLRVDDAVERPNDASYGWRDILMERVKLSRAEYALLTDRTIPLSKLFGFPDGTEDDDLLEALANVKAFARRIGVSYEEVVALLQTRFINPNGALIPKLERLGVPFTTFKALKDGAISDADFTALLPPGLDVSEYGGDILAWIKDDANFARIMGLITITNPTASDDLYDFDKLELRYANPDPNANMLRASDFIRILRFVRLWRKLGWTIEQTDQALSTLYPAADLPTGADEATDLQHLDNGFLTFLPRLGVLLTVMDALKVTAKKNLSELLACWAPLDTYGDDALYRQMFLNPVLLKQDPVFADDGYGNVLQDNTQKLLHHSEALRGAFNLTGDDLNLIVNKLGFDDITPLTLENISAVYRHGWLARALRLSVTELLALIEMTDLDPFAPLDPPDPPIARFLRFVDALRTAGLRPVVPLYLIWNQDLSGKAAPDPRVVTDFARTLRSGFAAVESEFALVDDPNGDIARARMALVYDDEATDFFLGLLNETLTVDVPYSHGAETLEQPIVDAGAGRIGYDNFRKRLSYTGVLTADVLGALKNVAGVSNEFTAAVDALFAAAQAATQPFFTRYPELLPLYTAYVASNDPPAAKRTALLASILPALKRLRKAQQALAAISSATRTDPAFAQALLNDATLFHATADAAQPALADLTAIETPGLTADFFWSDTTTANADSHVDAAPNLAYAASSGTTLPANPAAGSAISGRWTGYLEVPQNGDYNLAIETDSGATVTLAIDGNPIPLAASNNVWTNQSELALKAGLHAISLTVEKLTNTMIVRWETTGSGWVVVPPDALYPQAMIDRLAAAFLRFLKVTALAGALKLTANELAYLAADADHQIGGEAWPNRLPVDGTPDVATARALRDLLQALLTFSRLKQAFSPDGERLLAVLRDPTATAPNGDSLLLTLTGWDGTSLDDLLGRFGKTRADLRHLDVFQRVYDAFALVNALRIPASALIDATGNAPDSDTVRDLQSALRARYDQAAWLEVIQPINDDLRRMRRDALVAYILQQFSLKPETSEMDTPEKLFEYFLMDVEMDPCTQTSRVRHALSSVQLFIERCLLNLEPRVSPASIRADLWEWMKRYRVWEANRKVFLWPENWLEPELRDDQSPIFKETMSELLQSDITEDAAAVALLNYLAKLEEIAKLEPCGLFYVEGDPGTADDVVHVVARTAGAKRKYFYRRREYGYWTPWEQIKLDIEDNPVLPVVWRDRLLLFWLRIMQKAPINPAGLSTSSSVSGELAKIHLADVKSDAAKDAKSKAKITVQAVLCFSEYYNGKWQPTRTSDPDRPTTLGTNFDPTGENAFDRSQLQLSVGEEGDALRIRISGSGNSSFLFYNTHSAPVRAEDAPFFIYPMGPYRSFDTSSDTLSVNYSNGLNWFLIGGLPGSQPLRREILKNAIGDTVVGPHQPLSFPLVWDAPFFYSDSRHVFYVTTEEQLVMVASFGGFGAGDVVATPPVLDIPKLVQQKPRIDPRPPVIDPVVTSVGHGVFDPGPIERFVTEDAYIHTAIASTVSVRFGDQEIGPAGVILDQQLVRR